MLEKALERQIVKVVEKTGGIALKLTSPSCSGMPDRLILSHHGVCAFCEVKAPGGKLRPLQIKRLQQVESLGFLTFVIDKPEQIDEMICKIADECLRRRGITL
ncbi:MAG: VRR-NUC domain-containing protein [Holosporales bacterium]|jgi:hypothetical protein|nr:VRR-NUC domain-containing protein [Holosporales bacterium]